MYVMTMGGYYHQYLTEGWNTSLKKVIQVSLKVMWLVSCYRKKELIFPFPLVD